MISSNKEFFNDKKLLHDSIYVTHYSYMMLFYYLFTWYKNKVNKIIISLWFKNISFLSYYSINFLTFSAIFWFINLYVIYYILFV